jgi:FtsX-like permease family/MacB-like periplasmic core domain
MSLNPTRGAARLTPVAEGMRVLAIIWDLKYALRLLSKRPWFTSLTVLVLAGGLGISLYTFAVLNTMVYRDLPVPDGRAIVRIGLGDWPNITPLDAYELAQILPTAQGITEGGVYRTARALVGEPGSSRSVRTIESDWRIFETTRTPPLLGRGFVRDDSWAGGEPVAVLGYEIWQNAFSANAAVVGRRLLDELRGERGIEAAGVMQETYGARFAVEGREYRDPRDYARAWHVVLSTAPLPFGPKLIEGRAFDDRDGADGQKTAIVSESLARAYWPNESALGRRIDVAFGAADLEPRTIVGVVRDVRYDPVGLSSTGSSAVYVPLPQSVEPNIRVVVRFSGDQARTGSAMYEALARLDPTVPAGDVRTYDSMLGQITLFARTTTSLLAACGTFAVLIAIAGIYGMSSNAVVLRRHEIGLRRALGASNGDVMAAFALQGARQLAIAFGASTLLSAAALYLVVQAFSVSAWTLGLVGAAVVLVISAVVLLSIVVSVHGAIRLEPGTALRVD